jgi:hypothetical protein
VARLQRLNSHPKPKWAQVSRNLTLLSSSLLENGAGVRAYTQGDCYFGYSSGNHWIHQRTERFDHSSSLALVNLARATSFFNFNGVMLMRL